MQNLKNIILDYGNVIFMINFQRAQQAFSQLGVPNVEQVFAHKQQNALFDQFDKGLISPDEFRNGIRSLAGTVSLSDEQIDSAWNALLIGVEAGMHELLHQLKSHYRVFLLSNNNVIHYAYIMKHLQDHHGLDDNSSLFEKTYYSHDMGMRKPDADIFQHVLQENNLRPEETLFIDDSPQHVHTAQQLGIHTALCSSDTPLHKIIEDLHLLDK